MFDLIGNVTHCSSFMDISFNITRYINFQNIEGAAIESHKKKLRRILLIHNYTI